MKHNHNTEKQKKEKKDRKKDSYDRHNISFSDVTYGNYCFLAKDRISISTPDVA